MIFSSILFISLAALSYAGEFGEQLKQCRLRDSQLLNDCLLQILIDLKPRLRTGLPELGLPRADPLYIKNINFSHADGPINFQALFNNIDVTGISTFHDPWINADPVNQKLQVALSIPMLQIIGLYNLSGRVLLLPLKGNGTFWTNLHGLTVHGIGDIMIAKTPSGVDKLIVDHVNVDFDIEQLQLNLDNLFNGDPVLGPTVNNFLNKNGKELLHTIKPEVLKLLNDLVQRVMNDAFSQLPVDAFLAAPAA